MLKARKDMWSPVVKLKKYKPKIPRTCSLYQDGNNGGREDAGSFVSAHSNHLALAHGGVPIKKTNHIHVLIWSNQLIYPKGQQFKWATKTNYI